MRIIVISKDGDFTFFIIKGKNNERGSWFKINYDSIFIRSPEFDEFTASGDVWQQLGQHGTFNAISAIKVRNQLREKYPKMTLKVFKVKIKQEQNLMDASMEKDILTKEFLN